MYYPLIYSPDFQPIVVPNTKVGSTPLRDLMDVRTSRKYHSRMASGDNCNVDAGVFASLKDIVSNNEINSHDLSTVNEKDLHPLRTPPESVSFDNLEDEVNTEAGMDVAVGQILKLREIAHKRKTERMEKKKLKVESSLVLLGHQSVNLDGRQGVESSAVEDAGKGDADASCATTTSSPPFARTYEAVHPELFVSRCLQQRNVYLNQLSDEEKSLVDYLFYSAYEDDCELVVDELDKEVNNKNKRLRSDLEVIDAYSYMLNRKEEMHPRSVRSFCFPTAIYNYAHLTEDAEVRMEEYKKLSAEKKRILKENEGTDEYDKLKKELEVLKKTKPKPTRHYSNSAFDLMANWDKGFPKNRVANAKLIFVPVYMEGYITVLVLDIVRQQIKDIDSRKDHEKLEHYGSSLEEFLALMKGYVTAPEVRITDTEDICHWPQETVPFTWRDKKDTKDSGVFAIKAMELYDGKNVKSSKLERLKTVGYRNLMRCKIAHELATFRDNLYREYLQTQCVKWSKVKPSLFDLRTTRKEKEKKAKKERDKKWDKERKSQLAAYRICKIQ